MSDDRIDGAALDHIETLLQYALDGGVVIPPRPSPLAAVLNDARRLIREVRASWADVASHARDLGALRAQIDAAWAAHPHGGLVRGFGVSLAEAVENLAFDKAAFRAGLAQAQTAVAEAEARAAGLEAERDHYRVALSRAQESTR